ncbi:thiol-disulfide oxidoreductase DCC family protein [Leptolyngbya sp. AN02str]|uniref:thiol-disulfide oxidoreductase DCC family protein n=1 Tax=Leptolyngbya sp. AN02str TaxID=3423363 RepID=UPI003D31024F
MSPSPAPAAASTSTTAPTWQIKLLYDSACPLCMHEVKFLKKRDAGRGLVEFVDIADDAYDPAANGGVDFETAMGRIHAILPDGTIIKNVEVLRRVYEVLGMGWVYAITKLPGIGAIANFVYSIWARWRLPLTGRPSLETVIAQRNKRLACPTDGQAEGRCRIDS